MTSSFLPRMLRFLVAMLLLISLAPNHQLVASPGQLHAHPQLGCTTLYAYDGQKALGGNNEDFNNPFTMAWFIPSSPGRFGRVYFGYDDYLPQGGLNDQGVFFDGLALPYKPMPVMSQKPHFPGGDLALADEILSRSANVQQVIDLSSRWYPLGGEFGQHLYGDRFGDSVIIDGDTILRKQGAFQLATNFRLADNPNPPYPEKRFETLDGMLSQADHYSVELFRQALDAAHAEGDFPTLYSQVYELDRGIIHLYLFHDYQHEVTLNLADELAKGPHITTIASLFPKNAALDHWALQREELWKTDYEQRINPNIKSVNQRWMSGQYLLQDSAEAGPIKIYLENDQLYLQRPNQFPIALYPTDADTVFHHFFNGMDLRLTFERNAWGWSTGAQGSFSFDPYGIAVPYHLTRTGVVSSSVGLLIALVAVGIVLISLVFIQFLLHRRRWTDRARRED